MADIRVPELDSNGQLQSKVLEQVQSVAQSAADAVRAAIPAAPDLTGYATSASVDEKIAAIPAPDLSGYATSAEVDQKIAGFSFGVPIFETLAEAQEWEAAHPGSKALTLEQVAPVDAAPVAGTLSVSPSSTSAILSVSGASDDNGVTGYSFRVDTGAWSSWQSGAEYTASGLTASTQYTFQYRVQDTVGQVTEGSPVTASTTAAAPSADWAGLSALIKSQSPALYYPLNNPAGATEIVNEGSPGSAAGDFTYSGADIANVVFNGSEADFNGSNAKLTGVQIHTGSTGYTFGTVEAIVTYDTLKQSSVVGNFTGWHLGMSNASGSQKAHGAMGNSTFAESAVTAGKTHHLMHTFDGTTSKLYVNGVLAGSVADTRTLSANTYIPFGMGDGNIGWFDGKIKHAAMYLGKALTAEDALARAQKAGLA